MRLVAGIVAYNPDLPRLRENIEAISDQVDEVLVIDNGSRTPIERRDLSSSVDSVTLHRNAINGGMSGALNQIMAWARSVGATCAVLLDQDSVADFHMVPALRAELEPSIGVVAARYVDRNVGSADSGEASHDVDNCITSGSMCRVAAWEEVGGYDEQLFIDFVDFDFCLRLRAAGWRIRLAASAILSHEIGQSQNYGRVTAYGHSAFRSYHLARDMLVYARKHRRAPKHLKVNQRGVLLTCAVLLRRILIVARFEPEKVSKIRALGAGIARGLTVPLRE